LAAMSMLVHVPRYTCAAAAAEAHTHTVIH
jgi:hypothetical protein